jgi:hypothetical protein
MHVNEKQLDVTFRAEGQDIVQERFGCKFQDDNCRNFLLCFSH